MEDTICHVWARRHDLFPDSNKQTHSLQAHKQAHNKHNCMDTKATHSGIFINSQSPWLALRSVSTCSGPVHPRPVCLWGCSWPWWSEERECKWFKEYTRLTRSLHYLAAVKLWLSARPMCNLSHRNTGAGATSTLYTVLYILNPQICSFPNDKIII